MKNKIIYWVSTGLVSLMFIMSGAMYLSGSEEIISNFQQIGFPLIFISILGTAKLLGGLALINPWFKGLREWAYAGFSFVLIGAVWVHIATSTPFIAALVTAVLLGVSYYFNSKRVLLKA